MHLANVPFRESPLNERHRAVDHRFSRTGDQKTKVAIYAGGLGREYAPLTDPSWEVWALNLIPPIDIDGRLRVSRWFDLHQRVAQTDDDMLWIGSRCPVPIYVPPDLEDAGPMCVQFPIDDLLRAYPATAPYSCTFCYQIALALHEGATDIALCGVELRFGTPRERTVEWAGVSWWMGYAQALGVVFHVPELSWLGSHPVLYGFDYELEIDIVKGYVETVKGYDANAAVLAADRTP